MNYNTFGNLAAASCNRRMLLLPVLLSSLCLSWLILCLPANAEPTFPPLSGRVVDQAGILSAPVKQRLEQMLAQHEAETSNQVVVATLSSLQGYAIEDYGYQLGRHWQIGTAKNDNGALLIVAPNERKVRIEVGYGLEGSLTDAISHDIIQTKILPHFRNQDYQKGIIAGTEAILAAIQGTYKASDKSTRNSNGDSFDTAITIGIAGLILGSLLGMFLGRQAGGLIAGIGSALIGLLITTALAGIVTGVIVYLLLVMDRGRGGGYWGGYGGGGGFSSGGGGFSGGGGSFGGGGASGGW